MELFIRIFTVFYRLGHTTGFERLLLGCIHCRVIHYFMHKYCTITKKLQYRDKKGSVTAF